MPTRPSLSHKNDPQSEDQRGGDRRALHLLWADALVSRKGRKQSYGPVPVLVTLREVREKATTSGTPKTMTRRGSIPPTAQWKICRGNVVFHGPMSVEKFFRRCTGTRHRQLASSRFFSWHMHTSPSASFMLPEKDDQEPELKIQ